MNEEKSPNPPTPQGPPQQVEIVHKKWQMLSSQKAIVETVVKRHENELKPLKRYQDRELNATLNRIREELGIPEGYNKGLGFDNETLEFTYNGPKIYPPETATEAHSIPDPEGA